MNFVFRLLVFLPLGVIAAQAQIQFHVGLDAGVPITDTLTSSATSSLNGEDYSLNSFHSVTKRLLIGPSLRLDLSKNLGLEFDALYQRVDSDSTSISSVPEVSSFYRSFEPLASNRWQFPLLVQYNRTVRKTKLFAEAGPAINTIGNSQGSFASTSVFNSVTTITTNTAISRQRSTFAGITAGAGIDVPLLHAHLRPEFRYSHWFSPSSAVEVAVLNPFVSFSRPNLLAPSFPIAQNEASFLLGLSF